MIMVIAEEQRIDPRLGDAITRTYHYRVAEHPTHDAPQLTHRIEMRSAPYGQWESALMGGAPDRTAALHRFVDRYNGCYEDLIIYDDKLAKLVAERREELHVEQRRKEEEAQAEQRAAEQRHVNEDTIEEQMKEAKPRFKRAQITVATNEGSEEIVNALVLEDWAVHHTLSDSGYAVSHVPSGLRASSSIPTQKQARELAYRYHIGIPNSWNGKGATPTDWKAHAKAVYEEWLARLPIEE